MADILYYAGIDLQQNEIKNGVVHKLAAAPSSPVSGQQYYNTATNKLMLYDGTDWVDMSTHTISNVVTDGTYATLAAYISGHPYNPADFAEGDVLILTTATDPEERSYINNGGNSGTATDFDALSIAYDETAIKAMFSGSSGVTYDNNGGFTADVDDSTIQVGAGGLEVKASGITATELATDSVTQAKIADDSVGTAEIIDANVTQAKLHADLEAKIVNSVQTTLGDGALTTLPYTHGLGTQYITVTTYKVSTGEEVKCFVQKTSDNAISIGAFPAPALNDLLVIVTKKVMS